MENTENFADMFKLFPNLRPDFTETTSCGNGEGVTSVTDGKEHSDAGFVQVGEPDLNIPKSTTYKTDGPIMMYNKEEKKLTPIRDYMTGATRPEN